MRSLKYTIVIKIRKNLSNFQAIQAIQDDCVPFDLSLGYLEDVSIQHRYDIVQTTIPSICSFLITSYNTKYGLLIPFSNFFFSILYYFYFSLVCYLDLSIILYISAIFPLFCYLYTSFCSVTF